MKSVIFLLVVFCFLFFPQFAKAEVCGVFHKKVNDTCVKFDVPSNARLTYSGNSWECNRGYKLSNDKTNCEEIRIPRDAKASTIGGFNCETGFKRVGDECEKMSELANGVFFEIGSDFYCKKGFRKNEEKRACEEIKIPDNAFSDWSSLDGWNCFGGYVKKDNECKKFQLPEHGVWSGDFWKCELGYRKNHNDNSCTKVSIPENAHASDTFDGWVCNEGFSKNYRENKCED